MLIPFFDKADWKLDKYIIKKKLKEGNGNNSRIIRPNSQALGINTASAIKEAQKECNWPEFLVQLIVHSGLSHSY